MRPRELLIQRGVSTLSDRDLVMILLGSGIVGHPVEIIAEKVLSLLDKKNADVNLDDLKKIKGLGAAKSALLLAAFELVRRILYPRKTKIISPGDVIPVLERFADRKQEHFLCVLLNGAHEVMGVVTVTVGLVNRTLVHPREVFSDAISKRAAAVIVAHNHPSGNVKPSYEDKEVTKGLIRAGKILNIPLLDHIIFSGSRYYSFVEKGEMDI